MGFLSGLTGVGGGIVAHGRLLTGINRIAGEWGHSPLPQPEARDLPAPACYCGRLGCIETYLSGPGLAADHARRQGGTLDAVAIGLAAAAGDPACEASLQCYEARLARALAEHAETEGRQFDDAMSRLNADDVDAMTLRIDRLRDIAWCLRAEASGIAALQEFSLRLRAVRA